MYKNMHAFAELDCAEGNASLNFDFVFSPTNKITMVEGKVISEGDENQFSRVFLESPTARRLYLKEYIEPLPFGPHIVPNYWNDLPFCRRTGLWCTSKWNIGFCIGDRSIDDSFLLKNFFKHEIYSIHGDSIGSNTHHQLPASFLRWLVTSIHKCYVTQEKPIPLWFFFRIKMMTLQHADRSLADLLPSPHVVRQISTLRRHELRPNGNIDLVRKNFISLAHALQVPWQYYKRFTVDPTDFLSNY